LGFRVEGPDCGSGAGSYLRLIDFVYHSTLGLRVIKKKKVEGSRFRVLVEGSGFGLGIRIEGFGMEDSVLMLSGFGIRI